MANLTILRSYAQKPASELPSSILFAHTNRSMTIYDAYPKSIFHFLVLPRVQESSQISLSDLSSLKSLLKCNKDLAKDTLVGLKEDAVAVTKEIEGEMMNRYGFKWDIWIGVHAAPSMEHLHLHVISADLCSLKMKHKKHYNSFHPKLGFFLHIDDVLSWFDAEPSYFDTMKRLDRSTYESILKSDLSCCKCETEFKTIPKLKEHLQDEWDALAKRERARQDRKRKLEGKSESDQSKRSRNDAL